jgi:hypothetical protein
MKVLRLGSTDCCWPSSETNPAMGGVGTILGPILHCALLVAEELRKKVGESSLWMHNVPPRKGTGPVSLCHVLRRGCRPAVLTCCPYVSRHRDYDLFANRRHAVRTWPACSAHARPRLHVCLSRPPAPTSSAPNTGETSTTLIGKMTQERRKILARNRCRFRQATQHKGDRVDSVGLPRIRWHILVEHPN